MSEVATFPVAGHRSAPLSNIEAEAAFLGAVLIDNSLIDGVGRQVRPEHFVEPIHARIYECILALVERGAVTPVTLLPYLEADDALKPLGGRTYLARLTADGHCLLAPRELAEHIQELALRRTAALEASTIEREAQNLDIPLHVTLARLDALKDLPTLGDDYPLLSVSELMALPPPRWLLHGVIAEQSRGAIYAEPKALKSFAALDMGLHIDRGIPWHGVPVRQAGVIYICGEGLSHINKRIEGWHRHHNLDPKDSNFITLPGSVKLLEPGNVKRLLRAVNRAAKMANREVGLVIIDTLSRSIPGEDENSAAVMTAFVAAIDEIAEKAGVAVMGVHHAGKDKGRGMRGSSALLGALDFLIRADRAADHLTLTIEELKDDEPGGPYHFQMERVQWEGDYASLSTLVPVSASAPSAERESTITREQIGSAFDMLEQRWNQGDPLSNAKQTLRDGRYAPAVFSARIGGDADDWSSLLVSWATNCCIRVEEVDRRTKKKGFRVLERID